MNIICNKSSKKCRGLEIYESEDICNSCGRKDSCVVLDFLSNEKKLCKKCVYILGNIYSRTTEGLIEHVGESFKIISLKNRSEIHDFLLNEKVEVREFVMINSTGKYGITTHIPSIEKLANSIEYPEEYDFAKRRENESANCDICSVSVSEDCVLIGLTCICSSCQKEIVSSLRRYIKNNQDKIVSKSI